MNIVFENSNYLSRSYAKKQGGDAPEILAEDETKEKESDNENYILCRQCHQVITTPADRITVHGAHQHSFANPQGIIYEIGCFRSVQGCGYAGPATDEFTWFKGFSWRVAYCGMCLTHLGWLFISAGGGSFNGLIVDHLIYPD